MPVELYINASGHLLANASGQLVNDCGGVNDCDRCSGTTEDRDMQVTLGNILSHTCSTAQCEAMEGSYTLTKQSNCLWRYEDLNATSDCTGRVVGRIDLELADITPPDWQLRVTVYIDSFLFGDRAAQFVKTYSSTDEDCSAWSNLAITAGTQFLKKCDWRSATCHVTSL